MLSTRSRIVCRYSSVWACLATLWLGASSAIADQFVLFDATFTFTKDDADSSRPSPSHYDASLVPNLSSADTGKLPPGNEEKPIPPAVKSKE